MEPNLTASAVSLRKRSEDGVKRGAAHSRSRTSRAPSHRKERHLTLASVPRRSHTLVVTGELHHRSAHALEAEIERLCEEGVTAIVLDLRELTYIDSIGIAVIAFRSGLCKRRGHDFAVISGSPVIRRALEQAGVSELESLEPSGVVAG
jgi:stage II sporulation protein AA (anti-sigma F factor antagonist)